MSFKKTIVSGALAAAVLASSTAFADSYGRDARYLVSVTNITKGINFTPILAATHKSSVGLFDLGQPAAPELAVLAEGGDIAPLQTLIGQVPKLVKEISSTAGLLGPGQTVEFEISSSKRFGFLSLAAMLLPTNDTFVALDTVALPEYYSRTYFAEAYDAGSEPNDELCLNIPGPVCGGAGGSPDEDGEGFVHIAAGIHGEADLKASAYDWRGPVAKVVIKKLH